MSRSVLIGAAQGAVHTEVSVGALGPGGWLQRHFHSFEEALYVLAGELLLEIDGHHHRLVKGDYAVLPVGAWHALANAGVEETRWLSVNTPLRLAVNAGRADTFFAREPFDLDSFAGRAQRPPFGDPRLRFVGHYDGTPPQAEALALDDPARGRRPAGRDTALVVYSGISVKMLVDRVFGAELLTMFTVDYEPGGSAQVHDHPFEETYFFLEGEIEAELDGQTHTIRGGDVVFAGVGATHGFFNTGSGRVRWIETQAPQPPERHSYRWVDHWRRFEQDTG
ncbi:MAG TPA: cupin domain-containing protein [Candidatus Limnocylindria bacterium]